MNLNNPLVTIAVSAVASIILNLIFIWCGFWKIK